MSLSISVPQLTGTFRPQQTVAAGVARPERTTSDLFTLKPDEASKSDRSEVVRFEDQDPEIQRWQREKNQAKETFERLYEELKMVRKIWAHDPRELAAQLARLGKQLEKVMESYAKAQAALGDLLGGGGVGGGLAPVAVGGVPAAKATEADAKPDKVPDDIPSAKDVSEIEAETKGANIAAETAYAKAELESVCLDQTPFAMELRGDIEFAQGVRGFATKLREEYEAAFKKLVNDPDRSPEDDKAKKEYDKYFKGLEQMGFELVGHFQKQMPPAISVSVPKMVDVAA